MSKSDQTHGQQTPAAQRGSMKITGLVRPGNMPVVVRAGSFSLDGSYKAPFMSLGNTKISLVDPKQDLLLGGVSGLKDGSIVIRPVNSSPPAPGLADAPIADQASEILDDQLLSAAMQLSLVPDDRAAKQSPASPPDYTDSERLVPPSYEAAAGGVAPDVQQEQE